MAIKSRFQRRMARQSRKQQGRRQLGSEKVPYSVFPSSYEPTTSYQFRKNVENQTEGGPGTRGDGSFCSGMDEENCNAASLACTWETRSDTGTEFCKRRPRGAQKGRVAESLSDVEAREEARLKQAREQYKADAEMKQLFEAAAAPKRSRGRAAATQSVPPPPPPPPGPYGSYVPPSMPTFSTLSRSAPLPAPLAMPTLFPGSRSAPLPPPPPPMPSSYSGFRSAPSSMQFLPTMGSRSVAPPSSMPFLPTMGSRSVAPPVPFSPPAAPKKSRTAAKPKREPEPEQINLYAMTTDELRDLATQLGVKVAASNKSMDIIKKIEAKVAKMEAE